MHLLTKNTHPRKKLDSLYWSRFLCWMLLGTWVLRTWFKINRPLRCSCFLLIQMGYGIGWSTLKVTSLFGGRLCKRNFTNNVSRSNHSHSIDDFSFLTIDLKEMIPLNWIISVGVSIHSVYCQGLRNASRRKAANRDHLPWTPSLPNLQSGVSADSRQETLRCATSSHSTHGLRLADDLESVWPHQDSETDLVRKQSSCSWLSFVSLFWFCYWAHRIGVWNCFLSVALPCFFVWSVLQGL